MEEHSSLRKLAAILIADAVGFSRQMGEDEERTLRALHARRDLIENEIGAYHGRVFGEAGDSIVAEFPSAVDALKAALEIQRSIAELNHVASEEERMPFRIGINLGDVIVEAQNLYGEGINIAERLQTLAEPGGICISGSVREQVRDKFDFDFIDLGTKQLKNIARPIQVFLVPPLGERAKPARIRGRGGRPWYRLGIAGAILAVALAVVSTAFYVVPLRAPEQSASNGLGQPIIAVLPFENLSGDGKQDYFSDGITEDIVAALGRFSNLSVLASTATAKFKNNTGDLADLQQKLGVRYVVRGSVRRSGERIRVSVDLSDTDTDIHLWTRQFDRELTDVFAVQDEITRNITGALAIKLSRIEQDRAFEKATQSLDAYDYFLRGRANLTLGGRAEVLAARTMLEKAIELDPRYAGAMSALGETYLLEANQGWTEFIGDALKQAEALGRQALNLSPELTDAHQLLAFVYLARGEYDRAILEIRRAIEINPSDAYGYASLGSMLMWAGDAEGAIAAVEKAKLFDPTLPWDHIYVLGFAYFLAGRYDEAIATFEPLAGSEATYSVYAGLAAAYAQVGRAQDAKRAAAEVTRRWPFFKTALFVEQWRDNKSRKLVAGSLIKAGLK